MNSSISATCLRLGKLDCVSIVRNSVAFAVIFGMKRWADGCYYFFIFNLVSHIRGSFIKRYEISAFSKHFGDQHNPKYHPWTIDHTRSKKIGATHQSTAGLMVLQCTAGLMVHQVSHWPCAQIWLIAFREHERQHYRYSSWRNLAQCGDESI